jgi:hypothetical protein
VAAALSAAACSHAWDALDPGGGGASSSTTATGGAASTTTGPTGGHGGTTTASTTGGAGGHGGTTSSSTSTSTDSTSTSSSTTSSSTSSTTSSTGGPTHCGATNLLSWDFSVVEPQVWNAPGCFQLDGSNQGLLSLPVGSADWTGCTVETERVYDLRGDYLAAKVLQVPGAATDGWAEIVAQDHDGTRIFLVAWQGNLQCGYTRNGNDVTPGTIPYDPVAHRHWRLREAQGDIFCETSPDDATWTAFGTIHLAASQIAEPSAVRIQLHAALPPMVATQEAFLVDDVHGGPGPAAWCKASSLTDTFPDVLPIPGNAWDRAWTNQSGDSYDQAGDAVNFHFGTSGWSGASYQTSAAYDMTGERVTIQILAVPAQGEAGFAIGNDDTHQVYWSLDATSITCSYDTPTSTKDIWSGALPALPLWLGLRESGGKIHCELLQGGTWVDHATTPGGVFDPTRTDVDFGTWYPSSTPTTEQVATFDDYNLCPVP